MKRAMWVASALLTLGFFGCDRSSSPASNTIPSSSLPAAEPTSGTASTASSADQETGAATSGTDAMGGIATDACPIQAETAAITSVEVPDGAALVFQTQDPTQKRELRQELDTIARTQGSMASERSGETEVGTGQNVGNSVSRGPDAEGGTEGRTGFEGPGDEEQTGGWVRSATEARTEDTGQDVRLVFTTDSDVAGLREEVRDRADQLNQRCTKTP